MVLAVGTGRDAPKAANPHASGSAFVFDFSSLARHFETSHGCTSASHSVRFLTWETYSKRTCSEHSCFCYLDSATFAPLTCARHFCTVVEAVVSETVPLSYLHPAIFARVPFMWHLPCSYEPRRSPRTVCLEGNPHDDLSAKAFCISRNEVVNH